MSTEPRLTRISKLRKREPTMKNYLNAPNGTSKGCIAIQGRSKLPSVFCKTIQKGNYKKVCISKFVSWRKIRLILNQKSVIYISRELLYTFCFRMFSSNLQKFREALRSVYIIFSNIRVSPSTNLQSTVRCQIKGWK